MVLSLEWKKVGVKFIGAILVSWATFSVITNFYDDLFKTLSGITSIFQGTGGSLAAGGSYLVFAPEMIAFAAGLTLLLANFDFLLKK